MPEDQVCVADAGYHHCLRFSSPALHCILVLSLARFKGGIDIFALASSEVLVASCGIVILRLLLQVSDVSS